MTVGKILAPDYTSPNAHVTATIEIQAGHTLSTATNIYLGNTSPYNMNAALHVQGPGALSVGTSIGLPEGASLYLSGGVDASANSLSDASSSGGLSTLSVSGTGTTLNVGTITVGSYGGMNMTVESGASVTSGNVNLLEGQFGTPGAIVNVNGAGTTWTNSGDFRVGTSTSNSDLARLTIDQGQLQTHALYIGEAGTSVNEGIVTLQNGGSIDVATATNILSGSSLQINSGSMHTQSLTLSSGGAFHMVGGTVAVDGGAFSQPSGPFTLNGNTPAANPELQLLNGATTSGITNLTVGDSNQASLLVSNGSKLTPSGFSILGNGPGSVGTAVVSGAGSEWNSTGLYIGGDSVGQGGASSVSIANGGQINVDATTKVWNDSTLALDGGGIKTATLASAGPTGKVHLTGNANTIDITAGTSEFIGDIEGAGGFIKQGAGTLALNNNNTYSGLTTVGSGLLRVDTRLANNDAQHVFISAEDDTLAGNAQLTRTVSTLSVPNDYSGLGATELGGLQTTASLLYGQNTGGIDDAVSMQFRQRTASEMANTGTSPPLPFDEHGGLISDVLNLTGMVNDSALAAHQTDLFVLQMSYDETLLAGLEVDLLATGSLYLGYLSESTGMWANAVDGNVGSTANLYMGDIPWNSGLTTLGQWGVDTDANVVWAVLDHNSLFASVPEPSSLVLVLAES